MHYKFVSQYQSGLDLGIAQLNSVRTFEQRTIHLPIDNLPNIEITDTTRKQNLVHYMSLNLNRYPQNSWLAYSANMLELHIDRLNIYIRNYKNLSYMLRNPCPGHYTSEFPDHYSKSNY
jgi:hypothetical protein